MKRRNFLVGSAATAASVGLAKTTRSDAVTAAQIPYRWIDKSRCVGCGKCARLCPMRAISVKTKASIDPNECAECGVCLRSRVCDREAIRPGNLTWPRLIRETFSNPLTGHKSTGVPGRGTEGIKTNDVTNRYQRGFMGIFVELGRPALGARFRDVERTVKKFKSRGYDVLRDNPVAELIADPSTGALKPEILDEKVISALIEFVMPDTATPELKSMIDELSGEVETVFNVSVVFRAGQDGASPFAAIIGDKCFSLPNGKVNLGIAEVIAGKGA